MDGNEVKLDWTQIITRLSENAVKIKYGEAGIILKIHEGKVVHVTHVSTETIREPGGTITECRK